MSNQLEFREIVPYFEQAILTLAPSTQFKKHDQDIFCKCPICGDGKTGRKQRLHLYKKQDVININCFNGDCIVKNYTPYRFFKEFETRTFQQFQNFYKRRFLDQITNRTNETKLESVKAHEDLFEQNQEILDPEIVQEVTNWIEQQEFTNDDDQDLEIFKQLVKRTKDASNQHYQIFRKLLNL